MKRVLIIGFGSIGSKHADSFRNLDCRVGVLSQRDIDWNESYDSLPEAMDALKPEIVCICNKTSEHRKTYTELKEYTGIESVLIEKPVFDKHCNKDKWHKNTFVAYNLRHLPLLLRLKEEIQSERIISSQVYCGQYLPTWRPGVDYRDCYSSHKNLGGGVLRDLSHEIDYISWLMGKPKKLTALGGHLSTLEIDSEDIVSVLAETEDCPVLSMTINYLDHNKRRIINILTDDSTYTLDFINQTLVRNNEVISKLDEGFNTYESQAHALIKADYDQLCTFEEGLSTLEVINHIESSIENNGWAKL